MPMALYVVQKKYRRICVVHYKLHYVTELMKLSQEIVECSLSKLEHQRTKIAIISVVVTCKNTTPKQSKVVQCSAAAIVIEIFVTKIYDFSYGFANFRVGLQQIFAASFFCISELFCRNFPQLFHVIFKTTFCAIVRCCMTFHRIDLSAEDFCFLINDSFQMFFIKLNDSCSLLILVCYCSYSVHTKVTNIFNCNTMLQLCVINVKLTRVYRRHFRCASKGCTLLTSRPSLASYLQQ